VSANIEGDRHLERVIPFVKNLAPDVICLQEVFEPDLPAILGDGWQTQFLPMTLKPMRSGQWAEHGIAIASRQPVANAVKAYYHQLAPEPVRFDEKDKRSTCWHGVAGFDVGALTVFVTHFTWTPNGVSDANQEKDMAALLNLMGQQKPHILCGDFNIPRAQNSMYSVLAKQYTDHVPARFTGSLDLSLHYAARNPAVAARIGNYMVDYVLSNGSSYRVDNVEMHSGLSDHRLLTADISLAP
jgi:endonuclease/exonuclease/phosphatase family metal-dependent hydrolase